MTHPRQPTVAVYTHYSNGERTFSLRKLTSIVGEWTWESHPDECPDGEWVYRAKYSGTIAPQPDYYWLNRHEPRRPADEIARLF